MESEKPAVSAGFLMSPSSYIRARKSDANDRVCRMRAGLGQIAGATIPQGRSRYGSCGHTPCLPAIRQGAAGCGTPIPGRSPGRTDCPGLPFFRRKPRRTSSPTWTALGCLGRNSPPPTRSNALNRETARRGNVLRIYPLSPLETLIRRSGALLAEQGDEGASSRRYVSPGIVDHPPRRRGRSSRSDYHASGACPCLPTAMAMTCGTTEVVTR